MDTINTQLNTQLNTQYNTQYNTQLNTQLNTQYNAQLNNSCALLIFDQYCGETSLKLNYEEISDNIELLSKISEIRKYPKFNIESSHAHAFVRPGLKNNLIRNNIKNLIICGDFGENLKKTIEEGIKRQYKIILIIDAIYSNDATNLSDELIKLSEIFYETTNNIVNRSLNFGSSDSTIYYDILNETNILSNQIIKDFDQLKDSINWQEMAHNGNMVPRLICQQAIIENDLIPIYRHPVDYQLPYEQFDPHTKKLAEHIEQTLGLNYKLNHVLIQLYRSGADFIGEHSDKTLDVMSNTSVFNYTYGATRYMFLKDKINKSDVQYIALKNNSLFVLGPETNKYFYHGIKHDNRPDVEKSIDELSFDGIRISYTFRCINTFLNIKTNQLEGQGAPQSYDNYCNDYDKMIEAFGKENREVTFDWTTNYGNGFYSLDGKLNT